MKKWLIGVGGVWLICLLAMGTVTSVAPGDPAKNSSGSFKIIVDVPAAYAAVPTPTFYPILLRSRHPTPTPRPISP